MQACFSDLDKSVLESTVFKEFVSCEFLKNNKFARIVDVEACARLVPYDAKDIQLRKEDVERWGVLTKINFDYNKKMFDHDTELVKVKWHRIHGRLLKEAKNTIGIYQKRSDTEIALHNEFAGNDKVYRFNVRRDIFNPEMYKRLKELKKFRWFLGYSQHWHDKRYILIYVQF